MLKTISYNALTIYTDYNHITPKGNEIVARKIAELAAPLLAAR